MFLALIPVALSLFLAVAAWIIAKRIKRNRFLFALFGVGLALALLFPFRTYRVAPLSPSLAGSLKNDSLLYTKHISIPGYPNAYNPHCFVLKMGISSLFESGITILKHISKNSKM